METFNDMKYSSSRLEELRHGTTLVMSLKAILQELGEKPVHLSACPDVPTEYHNYFPARWSVTIAIYFLCGIYVVSNPVTR